MPVPHLFLVLAALLLPACRGAAKRAGAGPGPRGSGVVATTPPDIAVMATATGLVAVPADGSPTRALTAQTAAWCVVDHRADVVWFTTAADDGSVTLSWIDAAAPDEVHDSVRGVPANSEIIIDHGDAGRLGGTDPVSFYVGLRLVVSATPGVAAELGCEGDMWWYCYEHNAEVPLPEGQDPLLLPELEAQRVQVDALELLGPGAIVALAQRGAGRTLWSPTPPAAELPRVTAVPAEGCHETPEDCGVARPLPGTGYWIVIVSNSRGDFYHQTEQIYDPASRQFVSHADPSVRSPAPIDINQGLEGTLIAPSGLALAQGGRVVRFDGAKVWADEDAGVCGWLGGGWRVGGPRD